MNCYPKEYLELWEIKDEVVNTIKEANDLKKEWGKEGFICARRTLNFIDLARCYVQRVVGLKDKTKTKTLKEIKTELKTFF